MTNATKPLLDISKSINESNSVTVRLYFITRHLKPDVSKTAKMLEKHTFQLNSVDTDAELQKDFLNIATQQLADVLQDENLEVTQYEAIDDDSPKLYSYDISNKAIPFRDVVHNQIKGSLNPVTDMKSFLQNEDLWAYCVEIKQGTHLICLAFTKLYKSKVAVDESENPETARPLRYLRAHYNVNASKLELLKGNTINFERRVDCLYSFANGQMYVFSKSNFEKIASLEEEFREVAQEVVTKLKKAAIIEGLENISDSLDGDTALHKRLYKLAKTIEEQKLDKHRLEKIRQTIKQFALHVEISKDKLQIKTKHDLDEVIKLLEDYYLKSDQTGNMYGASVKKKIVV
ncbi:MAG: DUF4868 domain-containing protein [Thaumarchaeota archaeon]|nr:DUF4868 domain-containing protein [Nitrososphaerota archaeon]